jgi:hypothetical protein
VTLKSCSGGPAAQDVEDIAPNALSTATVAKIRRIIAPSRGRFPSRLGGRPDIAE